ncbi:branched-chain amino acid ABC transporter permease [Brevibacillus agri]|uniref:Branched-chain amino acid ABC transporter permease n=1 Tax=Brevibacillus agri TaxID=51101 RepID=A0A3M8AVZ4_9BACL|nr:MULTISPECIES: branched-chain amino acid ABC transporter permease [Brevibacillus]ELK41344.1 branched-chain amino acid ABC transporter permease [Brevibacillus agri BAB-2500]EJL43565.1 branched-chain amino acid ABC-type transport system, permease component [Brevibacillus sp. CF112]MBG9567187.1 ABC transporter permease [Brevibacillus agri]MBY0053870.1 branched-chain amino acid ABC transporter permease [Brevibacillus agri]MCG5254321.1 branched-chain amino acid ABC transporter permease [Brevibaci
MDMFWQLLVMGLAVGSIYGLIALGFVLIYKSSDAINFAQGEFVLVGSYVCLTLITSYQIPFLPALLLTLVFSAVLGWAVERVVLRPFIGVPVISMIMATIGLSSVMAGIVHLFWGTDTRVFPAIFPVQPLALGGVVVPQVYVWSLVTVLILLGLFTLFFKFSKLGIAMRATADDQQAALSMGISVKVIFAVTWAISAIVSSVGGVLLGNINGVNSSLALIGLKVLPVALLGGLDSIPGAIVGGFIIGVLETLAGGYLDPILGGGVKEVLPFVVLVLILMFKPYGLFGKREIERV